MGAALEPYEGQEPYIFVSYARKDKDRVFPLLDALQAAGYRFWFDAGIPWTTEWADIIAAHIDRCAVCLGFHSAASSASRHCKVELYRAMSKERPLLSVYLEDGVELAPGLDMYLNPGQSVKLSQFDTPEAFAARLGEEPVFEDCKKPEWHRIGQIQWKIDRDGVLTIAKNEDLPESYKTGYIPAYQHDPVNGGSTAPWMADREKIVSVVIADDVDEIGDRAFWGCESLTNVHIPDSVTTIGDGAFYDCESLTSVHIPDSVTTIGAWAFDGCPRLTSVEIPAGAEYVEDGWRSTFPDHTLVTRRGN